MKTPREAFKENFWIGAKGGLLDVKHVEKMSSAVWLFLYLLRSQTGLNAAGEGIVNYGHPLTFEEIAADFKGMPERTIRKWAARLRHEGYVRTEHHSNHGLIFWIAKAKPKTRKVKITTEQARSMLAGAEKVRQNFRPNGDASRKNFRPSWDASSTGSRPDRDANTIEEAAQSFAVPAVAGDSKTATPKGFTSEIPTYYNKDSHADTACSSTGLLEELIRRRDVPRALSVKELDARRRELLLQAEEIMRKHSAKEQPGKVAVIRKEAGQKPLAESGALSLAVAR